MRIINRIIVHCSATTPDKDVGAAEIDKWHKARGWKGIGYHYVIRRDGTLEYGRPIMEVGAHVKGHNKDSVGICLVGGRFASRTDKPLDHFTSAQMQVLTRLISSLTHTLGEHVTVHGHNEYANKGCPGFDVQQWWRA